MKGRMLVGLLAASVCFAPLAAAAQTSPPAKGQNQSQSFWEAQQRHWQDTAKLRQQVVLDQYELATMMINPKTTEDALLKKQREWQEARAKLEREQLVFAFQTRQKYPQVADSYGMMGYGMGYGGYGMGGYGMGYGMMGGYGMGPGMMGYGMGYGGYGMGPGLMGGYGMGPWMWGGHGTGRGGTRGGYYNMGPGMMYGGQQ
jgi:hypothetical protein